jgi:hypothetical protein
VPNKGVFFSDSCSVVRLKYRTLRENLTSKMFVSCECSNSFLQGSIGL